MSGDIYLIHIFCWHWWAVKFFAVTLRVNVSSLNVIYFGINVNKL